jgi:hypothetical protein
MLNAEFGSRTTKISAKPTPLAAPLNDWDDIPVNPATDLSHIY